MVYGILRFTRSPRFVAVARRRRRYRRNRTAGNSGRERSAYPPRRIWSIRINHLSKPGGPRGGSRIVLLPWGCEPRSRIGGCLVSGRSLPVGQAAQSIIRKSVGLCVGLWATSATPAESRCRRHAVFSAPRDGKAGVVVAGVVKLADRLIGR